MFRALKNFLGRRQRPATRTTPPAQRFRPRLEQLEARLAPALLIRLEQAGFGTLDLIDGAGNDQNTAAGAVNFIGSYGTFTFNVVTAISKPSLGGPNLAMLEMHTFNLSTGSGGTLQVTIADTDFDMPSAGANPLTLTSEIGGTLTGTGSVTFQSWANADNASPASGPTTDIPAGSTTAGVQGPFTTGAYASTTTTSFTRGAGDFSLFAQGNITLVGPGNVGFDGVTTVVGEPAPQPASISGYVYHDVDNDGVFDVGEAPIPGTSVTLTGTNDLGAITPVTVQTNAAGYYEFTNLRPGTYTVNETQPAGYLDGKDTLGSLGAANGVVADDNLGAITINAGDNGTDYNFGELLPASICGYVYHDADNDGIFDVGEAPIPGTSVTLTGTNDLGAIVPVTVQTDATGEYCFLNLRPGTYTVNETQPAGYLDGKDTQGTPGNGSTTNDQFANVTLTPGTHGENNNFGELLPDTGRISGRKVLDLTGNSLSADDTPLAGTTIQLYADTNNDGVLNGGDALVATTVSAAVTGAYSFDGLAAGRYFVKEVVPTGYVQTGPISGHYTVMVGAGSDITGKDFANFEKCDLDDFSCVYYVINGCRVVTDLRGNTNEGDVVTVYFTLDVHEPHQVTLVSYTAPSPTFVASEAYLQEIFDIDTGFFGSGTHSLTVNIPDCNYQIDFVCGAAIDQFGPAGSNVFYTPQGRLISADNDGCNDCLSNPSSLSGFVYHDADNDGVKDAGEAGLNGVLVTLTGTDNLGHSVTRTRITKPDGSYLFDNLRAGTYRITESQPDDYLDGKDTVGTVAATVLDDVFKSIALGTGVNGTSFNFGEVLPSSLSGYVWLDNNNDGDIDMGEKAISGVTVRLTGTDDRGNAVNRTDTTNTHGYYEFTGLRAGTYVLTETQPGGYLDGKDTVGSLSGTTTNDKFSNVVVGQDEDGINYNFGERPYADTTVTTGQTATIGFWQGPKGQALIKSLNGSSYSKALGNWLACTFPHLYGAQAGLNNLTGKTNNEVAAFFVKLFKKTGDKLDAQVMATALALYVTDSDLAGTVARSYGFKVTYSGTAAAQINVGASGAAFGVANNSTMTVLNLLKAVAARAVNGVLYNNDQIKRDLANLLLTSLNEMGDIE